MPENRNNASITRKKRNTIPVNTYHGHSRNRGDFCADFAQSEPVPLSAARVSRYFAAKQIQ